MTKKKFFLISQVFYPDEVSTANLFTNLCSVLVEDNYEVEVWCAQPSYSLLKRQPKKIFYNGINIHFLFSTNFHKNSLLGRLSNTITFILSASLKLLFSRDKETVFTHTTQPPVGIIISFICSIRKRGFVYILLDIFPEGLVRLGKVSSKSFLIKFWNNMFVASLRRCKKIVTIGRDMKAFIEKIYPESDGKIEYIPLWQDDKLVFPSDFNKNIFVTEYELQNRFVIQYSGNMGLWNDFTLLAKVVQQSPDDVIFMFVGGGIHKESLLKKFPVENKNNTLFLPFQPIDQLCRILTACHVAVVSLRTGLEGIAVPSKIYGILASGVPVIALVPDNSEIAYIIKEENCGYIINAEDIDGLLKVIVDLRLNEKLRIEMGLNGRNAFVKKYSTSIIAKRYGALIDSL